MTAAVVLQDRSMIPECVCVCSTIKCVYLESACTVHACVCLLVCVFSMQWSLCCSKRASAVSDGGDSLEATHQGDAIACVCTCLCVCMKVCVCVCVCVWEREIERKRVMLSYVSLLQPTHWGQSLTRQSFLSCTHTHTRTYTRLTGHLQRSKCLLLYF